MPERPLAGLGIAITRPPEQALALAERVRACGGHPILFPLLAIEALDDYGTCDAVIARLPQCDWAIFISSNAVEHGVAGVRRQFPALPDIRYAAVGPASAACLRQAGVPQVRIPASGFDSEALLALPELQQVQGRRILIFRGQGGRELLAETLRQRGAEVLLAECYRRRNPQADAGDLPRLWHNRQLHAIVVSSSEALRNLLALGEGSDWLRATLLCVNHPRIAALAQRHGLKVATASAPNDEALLQCLIENCPGHPR